MLGDYGFRPGYYLYDQESSAMRSVPFKAWFGVLHRLSMVMF